VEYDGDGSLVKVATKDSEWRLEGDKWNEYNAEGKKTNSAKSVEVSSAGDVTIRHDSGTDTVIYANGTDSMLTRNKQGHPDDIQYPDGSRREITYDRQEQPKLIKVDDGTVWRKEGQSWKNRGKDGKEISRADSVEVSDEGDVTIRTKHDQVTFAPDGRIYGIDRNDNDQPTAIKYENGRPTQKIEYDGDGHAIRLTTEGSDWRKEGATWNRYSPDGEKIASATSIRITKDGDITFRYQDGSENSIYRNGTTAGVTRDTAGNPTEVMYPDSRGTSEITYDGAGHPTTIRVGDGSEWQKGDHGWTRVKEDGQVIGLAD